MPAASRQGDGCTGHGAFPPRTSTSGSGNVFINGKPALRVGDSWAVHCNPSPSCHAGAQATGSSKVFVNGQALARIGDSVDCGSAVAAGSPNVFAG
ncbi:PaaR repeat-containing protein [Vibrio vulnificus]|uniref:PAAR domain-containing protein n=1 Tax=Vibrio vulnificus TaxID=672 RepID=UPI000D3ED1F2|nr:PAAR domain-containing protein [Vibrio vulnificus]MBN8089500.1 PAAR domain-containing protein [Vibrio vulnificus]MBN8118436.1 PAAR domain-containing protein [Vibrio vulnificus]PVA00574.1 PaaR repeat-containing protein [Vibrio vulnificus]